MRSSFSLIMVAVGFAVSACGGDDAPAKSDSEVKCEAFASTWCERSIGCLVNLGTIPEGQHTSTQEQCTDVAIASVQCKKAMSIGASYAQCLSDIRAMDCAVWNVPEDKLSTVQPPNTCRAIIVISP